MQFCGRSKKLLKPWLYLSKLKPRIWKQTHPCWRSQLRGRRKLWILCWRAMGVVTEWRSKPHNPMWKDVPGPGALPIEVMIRFFGTWDTYKSLKTVTESFFTFGITFWATLLQGRLYTLSSAQVHPQRCEIQYFIAAEAHRLTHDII